MLQEVQVWLDDIDGEVLPTPVVEMHHPCKGRVGRCPVTLPHLADQLTSNSPAGIVGLLKEEVPYVEPYATPERFAQWRWWSRTRRTPPGDTKLLPPGCARKFRSVEHWVSWDFAARQTEAQCLDNERSVGAPPSWVAILTSWVW
jgi:hypothetical protein